MANSNGWGDGSVNNNIGWGQGSNNTIGWGNSQLTSWSGATDIDGGNLPSNTVAPAITGTAQEGQTLTCSTGTWSGSPTYTYQWKRNGNNIGGATSSTYLVALADVGQNILCTVTATNFVGSATADSNTVVPISAFTGLLDTYSGAAAAYSLRRLSSTYTGNLIRVRRSSDNAEQNIGYNTNNVLDTTALLSFVGSGDGFVTTWYDQSGNTKNATQTTAANQPIIVSAGVVELNNSLANLKFSQDFLSIGTQVNLTGQHYMVYVGNSTNVEQSTSAGMIYYNANNDPSIRIGAGDNGRGILSYYNGAYQVNAETDVQLYSIITHAMTGSFTSTFYRNATQVATGSAAGALGNVTSFFIGTYSGASDTRNGNCQELIVWASDQSSNRTGITNNINGFYSAY